MSDAEAVTTAPTPAVLESLLSIDQSALDAISFGVSVCTADGIPLRWNRRAIELWGRPPRLSELTAAPHGALRIEPEGNPSGRRNAPVQETAGAAQSVRGMEMQIARPDGSRVFLLVDVEPIRNGAGRVQGVIVCFQEITKRKVIEEAGRARGAELQAIIDRTPFMLVRCSRDLRYRFVSRAYAKLIGRQPEETVGKPIAEVIGAEGFATIRPHIEEVLQGDAVEFETEINLHGVGKRVLRIAYWPERDDQGNVEGWIASILDITDHEYANQISERLASIVESSDDAIVSKNLDGVIVTWNTGAERIFGYPAAEAIGKPITILIPADRHDEETKILQRIRRGERVENYETIRQRKDGSLVHISLTISPVKDGAGRIIGASKIARNISGRKRAEEALARRANEQAALYQFTDRLYRATSLPDIYDAALDAIVNGLRCHRAAILLCDELGAMRFVASRGLTRESLKAAEGYSPWRADETSPEPVCIDASDRSEGPAKLVSVPEQDGIRSVVFVPLMTEGKLAGKFAAYYETPRSFTQEDIDLALTIARQLGFAVERMRAEHARRNADEALRRLSARLEIEVERRTRERDRIWNVSEDLLGVSNFEGYFVSINPAWTRLLGWNEDELKSMHVSELRHPDDAAHSMAGRKQLAEGVPTVRMENRFRHRDGSWRWLSWTMTADNGLIYVAGRDITAEKAAAAALERAQRQSAHLQKMEALGQLTGGVAHDFNNLLMIVSGHAHSLQQRLSNPKDLRALQAIQMASARGESLTRQLLAFSRSQPLNPTVVSPADAIHAIRDVLTGSLHVNIELSTNLAGGTWPICVDKSEFELALVNLAVNARDAMPDGGRLSIWSENVHLRSGDTPEGLVGDFVALRIVDTGCGIAPDILPKIFEPFFTTKAADKGTGLGLAQVYGFARRSGGTAVVSSELGRGTEVTLYLPRSHAPLAAYSAENVVQFVAQGEKTILVVEDNDDVRAVALSLLEQLGYRTLAAHSAAAALDTLANGHCVDLVFTDVVLPGPTDGLALARALRKQYPLTPVVLTTGYAKIFDSDPEFPVLRKPYQISALGRIIRDALNASGASATASSN
jgi:PAS domain S-box-containing protein